ncbi:MAG: ABC transporter permease [Prevotella sp.]|nr:ABC transporter permease [Prevotella sp.]MCR5152783.1 ABC transporter permease [Prevotella sp.]
MSLLTILHNLWRVMVRECGLLYRTPIYLFCMVIFPILCAFFFTTLLKEEVPVDLPIGIVDLDNSSTTRSLIRRLDGMPTTKIHGYYNSVAEARKAIQQNEIYGFLYFPKGLTDDLVANRQPNVSYYYSNVSFTAGSMVYKDLKTIVTLTQAGMAAAKLSALGKTEHEISAFLQPIALDVHMLQNPVASYNMYLSPFTVPGMMMLFIFLITTYSIGTELKFSRSKEWLRCAGDNIHVALVGKLLPQFLVYFIVIIAYETYMFGTLAFAHPGGVVRLLTLTVLAIIACQAFGTFMFGLMPSLRMSMSICSLWGMMQVSLCGATFPVYAMHPMIEGMSWLFPLRHYYMTYQITVFNGFPISSAYFHIMALVGFCCLPLLIMRKIKRAMLHYVYIP